MLVDDSTYDFAKGAFTHNLTCHQVLMGPQEIIDKLKGALTVAATGKWKNAPQ